MNDAPAPNPRKSEPLTGASVDFAYTIFWTKMVRGWDGARRALMAERVAAVLAAPGFEANWMARQFTVEGLDDLAHAGASLLALQKVLAAFAALDAAG
jgi:hypothetical protein